MKFGLFDHVDRSDRPLARLFDERLEYVKAADELGYYCYHVSEHHATPLNMAPAPGVYLGAVARATRRIRLGPLVYLLPLYSPLRMIEEIWVLDHLSHGRLDVGVGRGVSPFELNYHKVDPETSRAVFMDALEAIEAGLTHDRLNHHGPHFSSEGVPLELRPLQRPHPPIWYASSNPPGSAWGGRKGYDYVTLGATAPAKDCIDAFKAALGPPSAAIAAREDFAGGPAIGILRHVVIADSMAEAKRIAEPAYDFWYANLTKLEREAGGERRISRSMFATMAEAAEKGSLVLGSVDEVRAAIARQIEELGINYMILGFYFGTLAHEHAMRSLSQFATEIMPALERG